MTLAPQERQRSLRELPWNSAMFGCRRRSAGCHVLRDEHPKMRAAGRSAILPPPAVSRRASTRWAAFGRACPKLS